MIQPPPGPIHLLYILPSLLFPPVFIHLSLSFALPGLIPAWLAALLSIASIPVTSYLSRVLHNRQIRRAAARSGAVLPPRLEDHSFLGVAAMKQLKHRYTNGHLARIYTPWIERYGPTIQLEIFGEPRVFTMDPDHIKAVLATQFDDFEKGPVFIAQLRALLGTGVFNADGEDWKFHRSATKKFFTRDRISDFDNFDRHCESAIQLAKERFSEGLSLDFQDLVGRFTMDTATEFLFGHDMNSLSAGLAFPPRSGIPNTDLFRNHPSNKFVEAFVRAQEQSALRSRSGRHWPLLEFWKDRIIEQRAVVDQYISGLMEKGQQGEKFENEEYRTLLDYLKESMEDPDTLQDEVVNLLVAGRDTTACLLSFGIYMLAEHPEVANKLYHEVMDVAGPSRRPTFEDIKQMKYLRAFLNEVLRLYPPVPYNQRTTNKDTVFRAKDPMKPDYYIPAKTRIHYSVLMLHRREDLWGPTASQFDPDRFIDSRMSQYLLPNPFIFLPFNAGPRICLGQQFSYNEASYFLVRWMQAFGGGEKTEGYNIKLAPEDQPMGCLPPADNPEFLGEKIWPTVGLTLYIKGGLWVKME